MSQIRVVGMIVKLEGPCPKCGTIGNATAFCELVDGRPIPPAEMPPMVCHECDGKAMSAAKAARRIREQQDAWRERAARGDVLTGRPT